MNDQVNKPKGTFAKLMSSSPIQENQDRNKEIPENPKTRKPEIRESRIPENLKSGNRGIGETGNPENLKSGNRDFLKAVKYSTQIHPDLIKRLKQYALVNEVKDYEVVEEALTEYLNKKQS